MSTTLDRVTIAIGPKDREHVDEMLEIVEAVAGPADATVSVLHVFPRDEYEELAEQMGLRESMDDLAPDELAMRHDDVRVPAERFEQRGIDHEIHGTVGDPVDEIVRATEERDVDLLFIGGTERSPAGKALFGDSAQQILLNTSCPVTYVRRG